MATKSYRSYLAFTAPDEMIQAVEEAINKQGIKEANKGNIAKLEICKKSYREDIVIGDLYVVPSSVCKKAENFPIALLASGVFGNLNQEESIEARMQFLASEDMSKDTLKMAKEMLFKNADGEECDLVVFHPAWANISDIKVIHYNKETLFLDLRDKVFNALYNPALSNSFEQIKAITGAYRVESIPLQQHVFKTPRYGTEFPELEKGSEIEPKDIKVDDKSRTSATVGKEALKDLKIKTTFRLIASSLVKPEESRKKIRLSAAHIEELEESILEPEELKLFNKVEDILENKIGSKKALAETGLRMREDYGAPGSKETVGPELVDGPDPKKAGSDDVIEDAKMVIQYLKTQVKKMDESENESEPAKYDKMFDDYMTLENFVRTGGKDGSGKVQQIIQDHMVNMPDASSEIKDVKNQPAQVISSEEDTKVVVEMPVEDFVKEHENLVDVLEHGSDEEQFEEGVDQGKELKKVEATDSDVFHLSDRVQGLGSRKEEIEKALATGGKLWFVDGLALPQGTDLDVDLLVVANTQEEAISKIVADLGKDYADASSFINSESVEPFEGELKEYELDQIKNASVDSLLEEASSEDILREELPMDADDWFKHEFEEPKKASIHTYHIYNGHSYDTKPIKTDYFVQIGKESGYETLEEAKKALLAFRKKFPDANLYKWLSNGGMIKVSKDMISKVKPKNAFTLLVPGQVLEGFYPELAEQLAIQPLGRENYHSPTPEILQKNLEQQDSGDAVRPPTGLGLGPNEPTGGVPLRKELNLRGPGFTNTFYGPHDDISPNSLLMASAKKSKNASLNNKMKLSEILKKICGQVASTLIYGFQVTNKPMFTDVPMEWVIRLNDLETGMQMSNVGMLPATQTGFGFKALAEGLNDTDLTDALNGAWAQGAVWNDEGDTGFTYEVFVRAEKLDIEGMSLKIKYVIKKKD